MFCLFFYSYLLIVSVHSPQALLLDLPGDTAVHNVHVPGLVISLSRCSVARRISQVHSQECE